MSLKWVLQNSSVITECGHCRRNCRHTAYVLIEDKLFSAQSKRMRIECQLCGNILEFDYVRKV